MKHILFINYFNLKFDKISIVDKQELEIAI
jgi:hypothetical protein